MISVILPVYNAELYIATAIRSVLDQTFGDFELLIYDDGSTDNSLKEIQQFDDPRIRIFTSATNGNYVKNLNTGIDTAAGKYIIRMDADDICIPTRFEKQYAFVEKNPEVGVCGSSAYLFGDIKPYVWQLPATDAAIKSMILFRIPFIHPSVIIRKQVLDEHQIRYRQELLPAEDYAFWCSLAGKTAFANLPEVLLHYRQHAGQVSKTKKKKQQDACALARQTYFRDLFDSEADIALYQRISSEEYELSMDFFRKAIALFKKLEAQNNLPAGTTKAALHNELSYQLFRIGTHLSSHKIKTLSAFRASGFSRSSYISPALYLKYILKNFLNFNAVKDSAN